MIFTNTSLNNGDATFSHKNPSFPSNHEQTHTKVTLLGKHALEEPRNNSL